MPTSSTLALAHGGAYSKLVKNPVFVVDRFSKVVFAFGFVLGTFSFVLVLVQVHFSGYAAGFGWLLCGLGSNAVVNADGFQQPLTLVRWVSPFLDSHSTSMKHPTHDLASIIGQFGTPNSIRDQLNQLTGQAAILSAMERVSQPRLDIERYMERYLGSAVSMHRSLEQYLRPSGAHEYAEKIEQQSRLIQEEYKRTLSSQADSIFDKYGRAQSLQTSVVDQIAQLTKYDLFLSHKLAQDIQPIRDQIEAIAGKLMRPMFADSEWDSMRQLQRMLREAALDQVSVTETGSIKVAGEVVVLDGTTWDMERVTLTPQPAAGLLEDLVSWFAGLVPLVRSAVIYLLLPYLVSIVANINTPLHEEWWRSLQANSARVSKKELRQGASAAYSSTDLETFRFVTAKSLSIHDAARQRSPTTDHLPFGKVVRLLSREGSWSYVEYAGGATREVQQGWVLSRYLEKFDK